MVKFSPLGRVTGTSLLKHFGSVKLKIDFPLEVVVLSDTD
jgi:hypothetical protein